MFDIVDNLLFIELIYFEKKFFVFIWYVIYVFFFCKYKYRVYMFLIFLLVLEFLC